MMPKIENFTKADLNPGMIVELRNGNCYMIHEFMDELILVRNRGWLDLLKHDDDLLRGDRDDNQFDIMIIRKPKSKSQLIEASWKEVPIIWERKELPKLTEVERVILENAMFDGKKIKWIGRDRNRWMRLYNNKPEKGKDAWISNLGDYVWFNAYNHLFQFVKWEDDEPWYIPDLLGGVDE